MNEEKKMTGYPSVDKPWLRYFNNDSISAAENPMKCSLYQYILAANQKNMEQTALEYFDAQITYKQLFERIDVLSDCFYAYGIKAGNIVTLCLPNVPELVIAIYALNKIGAAVNLIDPRVNSERILEQANTVNSKLLIVIRDLCRERIDRIAERLTARKILVVSAADSAASLIVKLRYSAKFDCSSSDKYITLADFMSKYSDNTHIGAYYKEGSVAAVVFTSGTTGTSKGVMLSNEGIIAASRQLLFSLNSDKARRFLAIIPFTFAYGLVDGMNTTLGNGMTLTLVPKYKPSDYTKLVLKHRPNVVISVPKFWEDMAYTLKGRKADLSFMIYPISGGDKISDASVELINACLKDHNSNAKLLIGYGATEFGAAISFTTPDGAYEKGSAGELMPIAEAKIIDPDTNKEIFDGKDGEIVISAQSMMLGYYDQPQETQSITYIDENGTKFYRTGDKGHLSEKGSLFIVDRYKRAMMRPDGHTVHATPIENIIMSTGLVRSCAVVGLKLNGRTGVIPTAYIVLNENVGDIGKVIKRLDEISLQKLPDRDRAIAYITVDKLPYTLNGKVDFRALENTTIDKSGAIITDFTFINKRGETR